MGAQIETVGNAAILEWQGPLMVDNHGDFKLAIEGLVQKKQLKIAVGLSQVDFIDSVGLGAMRGALRRLKDLGGNLVLFGIQEDVKPIFEITGLYKLFSTLSSREEAVRALGE